MERFFGLKEHGTNIRQEIVAGVTTFLTMAYILAVNPEMLSQTGMDQGGVFTATVVASAIATIAMACLANLPVALAPGMGLNAFFTYTVVIGLNYPWQLALTAILLEGLIFIVLSLFNVRELIIKAIPANLKRAAAVGIGLFITLIGLINSGIIVGNPSTLVSLGSLIDAPEHLPPLSPFLAILGLLIIIVLYANKIPGGILIGIILTTILGIPLNVTRIPENFSPLSLVSLPSAPLFMQFDFRSIFSFEFFTVLFTFLFVDIFDTIGTLVGVATEAKLMKKGEIPRVKQALLADAIGTVAGACLGTSTVTSYVESTAGVASGGRTGLTSLVTALLFLFALFLSPLFLLIPSAATAPALIVVGFFMIHSVTEIDFTDPTEGIPAFLTIVMMPFAYSIAEGLVYGILSFVVLKTVTAKYKEISLITWILFIVFLLKFFIS
ncbi:MAG: NCS2 family permease [Treponema sp.]|jgi:AGZA family xanthine/uracil permease-like MFS transporter|nr:NCS2 family permease [Treponema sp.]